MFIKKFIAAIAAAVLSVGMLAATVSADDSLWVNMEDTYLGDMYTYFKDSKPEELRKEAITKKDVEEIFDVKVAIDKAQFNGDLNHDWLEYGDGILDCYLTMTPKKSTDYTRVDYYVRIVSVDGKAFNYGYKKPKYIEGINGKYGAFNKSYESWSEIAEMIGMYGGSLSDIYYAEFSIAGLFRADGQGEPVTDCVYRAYYPGSSKKAPSSKSSASTKPSSDKLAAPTGVKGAVSENKIVLTWNKVSGAKAYRVYKYDPKTGKYLKYKDVGGEKCTVTGLKSGTKYSFKVYALTSENGKFVPQNPSKAVSFTTKDKEEFNDELITL